MERGREKGKRENIFCVHYLYLATVVQKHTYQKDIHRHNRKCT